MNLSTMRTLLRRRLQERVADDWADSDLDQVINVALGLVQTKVMAVHPDAFLFRDTRTTAVNEPLYDLPSGSLSIVSVEYKDSTGAYKRIKPMKYLDTLERDSSDTTQKYARVAKYICLSPAPTAVVADAIRIWYIPTVSVSAATDVPDIVLPLHYAAVLWAQIIALGDRKDSVMDVKGELAAILADIPNWYLTSGDEPATLDFDLRKDELYGYE
jgi:hypothetical protein